MCNCNDNINSVQTASGPQGPTGSQGPAGPAGEAAYGTVSASSSLGGLNYLVTSTQPIDWSGVGQVLFIVNSGYYKVVSITDTNNFTLQNLQYQGNTVGFTNGSRISPGGLSGKGFIYETADGNGIAATTITAGTGANSILVRNSSNTGYTFITPAALRTIMGL